MDRKGYYDAMISSFEEIREKRDVLNQEVEDLELKQRALMQKIAALTDQNADLEDSIADKDKERETCTGFLDDLEAGGVRAKQAMMRLSRVSMTVEERTKVMRQDLRAELLEACEPASPKLGSSKKMTHEAIQTSDHKFTAKGKPPLTVRCYSGASPGGDGASVDLPVMVYFHGEGFVAGDLETHDWLCRSLAAMSRVTVASVDYQRAPEARFPSAFEDAYGALQWVAGGGLGRKPPRLAVAGDCAGGGLAAACCIHARDDPQGPEIHLQVLFYPWLDLRPDAVSLTVPSRDGGLLQDNLFWYRQLYSPLDHLEEAPVASSASEVPSERTSLSSRLRPGSTANRRSRPASGKQLAPSRPGGSASSKAGPASPAASSVASPNGSVIVDKESAADKLKTLDEVPWYLDPRASPVLADSLARLPRAFIAYAEDDPVGIDSVTYAERLAAEGLPEAVHTLHLASPSSHGFARSPASAEGRAAVFAAAAYASASLKG